MKKSKNPAIYAFIDSQNLNLGIQDQGWRLDFGRFRVYLKDKYRVTKAFLFIGYIPKYKRLYSSLKKFGYILVFKPTLPLLWKFNRQIDYLNNLKEKLGETKKGVSL